MKKKESFYTIILILSIINLFYSLLNMYTFFKIISIIIFIICLFLFIQKKDNLKGIIKTFIIIFLSVNILYTSNMFNNKIQIDFNNKNYSEIYRYAKNNNITLKTSFEYSDKIKKIKL